MENNRTSIKTKVNNWLSKVRLNTEQRSLHRRLVKIQNRIKKYKSLKQKLQIEAVVVEGWIRTDQEDLDDLTQQLTDLMLKNAPKFPEELKKKTKKKK